MKLAKNKQLIYRFGMEVDDAPGGLGEWGKRGLPVFIMSSLALFL